MTRRDDEAMIRAGLVFNRPAPEPSRTRRPDPTKRRPLTPRDIRRLGVFTDADFEERRIARIRSAYLFGPGGPPDGITLL